MLYLVPRRLLPAGRTLFHLQKYSLEARHTIFSRNVALQTRKGAYSAGRLLNVAVGAGLSIATISMIVNPVSCDMATPARFHSPVESSPSTSTQGIPASPLPSPPVSSVKLYELSFGTVAGVCAGIFIKKGVKAVAFFVGGVYILLQYFSWVSLVRVDWARAGSQFENLFYTTGANGVRRAPSIVSLWRWTIDFLTADFQPRASFVAGLALGLRIG